MSREHIRAGLIALQDDREIRAIQKEFPWVDIIRIDKLGWYALEKYEVLWCHALTPFTLPRMKKLALLRLLKQHVLQGGGLLLSLCGAPLINDLGCESVPLNELTIDKWNHDENYFGWEWDFLAKKGFQGFLSHPIFEGLGSSVMTWASGQGKFHCRAGLRGRPPKEGEIVAKRKRFIFVDVDRDEILEYELGRGKILVISSLFFFSDHENPYKIFLKRFAKNILLYLANQLRGSKHFWPKHLEQGIDRANLPELPLDLTPLPPLERTYTDRCVMSPGEDAPFDVAGRRCFVVGTRRGGIKEIWCHPVRILKDLKMELVGPDGAQDAEDLVQGCIISPQGVELDYRHGNLHLRQLWFCPLEQLAAISWIEARAPSPSLLRLRFRCDLRLMWPYPRGVLGRLKYSWNNKGKCFLIQNSSGEFSVAVGCGSAPAAGFFEPDKHTFRIEIELPPGAISFAFVVVGGEISIMEAQRIYENLFKSLGKEYLNLVSYYRKLDRGFFALETTDREFDLAYSWAKIGIDKLFVHTPGVGRGFLAGYGPSRPTGFSDGRPGYAWYFGRDSEWISLAAASYGDTEKVKENINLLLKYQDVTGKICHKVTTSKVPHYDAADSTPLLIILLEDYMRRSGDRDFIAEVWPKVKRAMDFLYSTDKDHDGFIENSEVGHGWTEGGDLTPFHVSFYLAGIWVRTLLSAARLAAEVGQHKLSRRYVNHYIALKEELNTAWWNEKEGFFHFAWRKDGTFCSEKVVTGAVPLCFGLVGPDKATQVLQTLARHEFSTDWGVRFISKSSPRYRPDGYHQGSVWPLFTGWVSLAEYRYHRPIQGFCHLASNLWGYKHWNVGYIEEVLDGEVYQPRGICSHQGWSELMAVYPLIEGLFGLRIDVLKRRLVLSPHLPAHWLETVVRGIRFGSEEIHIAICAAPGRLKFHFIRSCTKPIEITLAPGIPALRTVKNVVLNGKDMAHRVAPTESDYHISIDFQLGKEAVVEIEYDFELDVVPPVSKPRPGDHSEGIRVVDVKHVRQGEVAFWVQGPQGEEKEVEIVSQYRIKPMGSVDLERTEQDRFRLHVSFPTASTEYVDQKFILKMK